LLRLPYSGQKRKYEEIIEGATVTIGVSFKAPGRRVVICADPRKPGRYVAAAVWTGQGDRIEEFALKLSVG
jgi:hypothetical protein